LNDTLDDELRQELLTPFVTRLAGSRDTREIETARAELMLERSVVQILAPALGRAGLLELAERCRSITSPAELLKIARTLETTERCKLPQRVLSAIEHAADAAAHLSSGVPTDVVFCTFSLMREIAAFDGSRAEQIYRGAAAILAAALDVGNQAEIRTMDAIANRLDAARQMPESAGRRERMLESA
jgi:hypothetical protein